MLLEKQIIQVKKYTNTILVNLTDRITDIGSDENPFVIESSNANDIFRRAIHKLSKSINDDVYISRVSIVNEQRNVSIQLLCNYVLENPRYYVTCDDSDHARTLAFSYCKSLEVNYGILHKDGTRNFDEYGELILREQ